ncbi:hypothetical protein pdam_00007042, partial [Pocillopora damicornis]
MCADKGTKYQTFRGCFPFRSGLKQPTKEGRAPSKRLVHASMHSRVPDHCRAYALSDPSDQDYLLDCDHDHKDRCDRTSIKWEGVSFISNIQHGEECLRVWKAYKIGPGKLVPY